MSGQRRVPAGQAGGGRFATAECPSTLRRIVAWRPGEELPAGWSLDPANPQRTVIAAQRCPHGHFARWAARNCCKP